MKKIIISTVVLGVSAVFATVANAAPASPWKSGDGVVTFPKLEDSHFRTPSIMDMQHLDGVDSEMSKWQVVNLIGRPHWSEGAFNEHVWDYAFRIKQDDGSYKVCQYQIHFDRKRTDSSRLLTNKDLYSTCTAVTKPAAKPPRMISLSADALFAFGRSSLKDLNPKGRAELDDVARNLNQAYSSVNSIKIVGHTDRIGSAASNMTLSRQRAQTVRAYLVGLGIPASLMSTDGMGKNQPVNSCSNKLPRAQQIICLQPNRRVTLQIEGVEKIIN